MQENMPIYLNRIFAVLLSTGSFLFSACGTKMPSISPAKMSSILTDMHLADSYAQFATAKDSLSHEIKNQDTLKWSYARVFQIHKVSENEFKDNLNWYKKHPDLLDSVYEKVLSTLAIYQSKQNR